MGRLESIHNQFNLSQALRAVRAKINSDISLPDPADLLDSFDTKKMIEEATATRCGDELAEYINTRRIPRLKDRAEYDAWLHEEASSKDLTRMAADLILLVAETAKAAERQTETTAESFSKFSKELETNIVKPILDNLHRHLSRSDEFQAKVSNFIWNLLDLVGQRLGEEAELKVKALISNAGLMLPPVKLEIKPEDLRPSRTAH